MELALLGNPNTGKTSLFNHLTGTYEYVGNWNGVTVEKKIGTLKNKKAILVDLPGVYSLTPISEEEAVVTKYLLEGKMSRIVNIIDASQLKRNLLLSIQLIEYGKPVIFALNMIDIAKRNGKSIDYPLLATYLGATTIAISARKGNGCEELSRASTIKQTMENEEHTLSIHYGEIIEEAIEKMTLMLQEKTDLSIRWLTIQLLDGNAAIRSFLTNLLTKQEIDSLINDVTIECEKIGKKPEQVIYLKRREVVDQIVQRVEVIADKKRMPISDNLDYLVTNKYLGFPIFIVFMYLLFMMTFDWFGTPLSDLLDYLISDLLTNGVTSLLTSLQATDFIESLVIDGIIAGVGGVLVFVPQIFILFFCISFLEDSGYMSRVALVMDKWLENVGLNGKAFIPMIIGFGCNVPGVMAARTIETKKERLLTILLLPLMSCSARFPVYALFIGAFFGKNGAIIVLSLYILSIVMALLLAKLFSSTILKGEKSIFLIELPPYRLPSIKVLWKSTWDKGKGFLKKAGTFIFAGSVFIWLLTYLGPGGLDVKMDQSFLALIGSVMAPVLAPLGFGTWEAGASLLTGFLAKEAIISAMNIIYAVPDTRSLQHLMGEVYTPLASYSFMVFILLYIPCLATLATIYKETGSKKWSAFSVGYALILAYLISFVIYQLGKWIGLN